MPRPFLCASAVLILASLASSQQTFVVSSSGGGSFTKIQPAIDAAQPGDIILVRAGTYQRFFVDKSLRVLGDPGAVVQGLLAGISVTDIPAGGIVSVRGFVVRGGALGNGVFVSDSQGLVHFEDMSVSTSTPMRVQRSAQVSLLHCTSSVNGLQVYDSTLAATECQLVGIGSLFATPGLIARGSRVTLAYVQVQGGAQVVQPSSGASAPGMTLTDSTVTITGAGTTTIAAGRAVLAKPAIQISGSSLTLDPAVTLEPFGGAPPIAGAGAVVMATVPAQKVLVASGTLSDTLRAPRAQQGYLIAAVPLNPPLPLPFGDLWVSAAHVVLDSGPLSGGTRTAIVSLPPLAPGSLAALQWAVVGPGGLALSTPAVASLDL